MRSRATFIASLLLFAACGDDAPPRAPTSDFQVSNFKPASAGTQEVGAGTSFVDVTKEAGIDFVHVNGAAGNKWLPETMGGGVGVLDYDVDGDPDLLFIQSAPWEGEAPTMKLYRNDGDWKFVD
ncbi:MAG: CRTAC1 family protein, partial [Planctomycetota bacterium]